MNWEKIREKYPKAWDLLIINHATHNAWGEIDSPEVWDISKITSWELRHLYDFFDEQEIYASVFVNGGLSQIYLYMENGEPEDVYISKWKERTRQEAETEAFLKAFEILEEKLSSPETPGS